MKLLTLACEVFALNPAFAAFAVNRQETVSVLLTDLNGINMNSLALRLGTNLPVTLADARLTFDVGQLTYPPSSNEFLGDPGGWLHRTGGGRPWPAGRRRHRSGLQLPLQLGARALPECQSHHRADARQ